MAGYLFGLNSIESLHRCIATGVYSTKMSEPKGKWAVAHEGTFADYSSMKEGDNVYFFIERKVYGIGKLVKIGNDCKYLNYPDSNKPISFQYRDVTSELLVDYGEESSNNRFICLFEPAPYFFINGIDMDDLLLSNPEKFKILRAFWKLSFIKFSDDENQAFKDILLQRNYQGIVNPSVAEVFTTEHCQTHQIIKQKVRSGKYTLSISPFLNTINEGGYLRHEMAVEAALIYQISKEEQTTVEIFGNWDYLSHQVPASPFKPIDYIDKMDIFGYSYIPGHKPTIAQYLVIELKKDTVQEQDILQLMKYVDWVKNEYSLGDYSKINAFLVGFDFHENCFQNFASIIERKYIIGVRPSVAKEWKNVQLVKYSYSELSNMIEFAVVADANSNIY